MKTYVTVTTDEKDSLDIDDEKNPFLAVLKFVQILNDCRLPYQLKITNMPRRPGFVKASEM